MIISFIRHGESISNAQKIFSSDVNSKNGLTANGIEQIKTTANTLAGHIDSVYASPFLRTVESAQLFIDNRPEKLELKIDERLREINYGNCTDKKDSIEMAEVGRRQIAGDYEVRFGETGENKREILTRLYSFLIDLIDTHKESDHIVAFSHGRVISILEGSLKELKENNKQHSSTGNAEAKQIIVNASDKKLLINVIHDLDCHYRVSIIENKFKNFLNIDRSLQENYKKILLDIARNGMPDIELSNYVLDMFSEGLYKSDISIVYNQINRRVIRKKDTILLCALKDSQMLVKPFIHHYKKMGIKIFVFIDNNSNDNSVEEIKQCITEDINIDIWATLDLFDGFKAMGWKQRLIAYYGVNRWFLNLDIDELLIYEGVEYNDINSLIKQTQGSKSLAAGSIMLDVYPNRKILCKNTTPSLNILDEYRYIDYDTYIQTSSDKFKHRIFGGPRFRVFGIKPSLQKYPLIYADKFTIGINPHFWYPYSINLGSQITTALLHYKFLPGDLNKYQEYARTGIHWNNSKEYKAYIDTFNKYPNLNFYDSKHSIEYLDSSVLTKIVIKNT